MSNAFSKIQKTINKITLDDQKLLQRFRDDANAKYTEQYHDLINEIDYLRSNEIVFHTLQNVNDGLKQLLENLMRLFDRCKTICKRYAPIETFDQLDQMENDSKYAYAQTCKSIRVIEDCVKFLTLYALFEMRLQELKTKIDRLDRIKRRTLRAYTRVDEPRSRSRSRSKSRSRSQSRSRIKLSPGMDPIDLFYKRVDAFSRIIKERGRR